MDDGVTDLPDGSAFAVASWPLPKDHWLYAPRGEWDNERDEYAECPRPILTNAQREAVIAAARYAIRGATMCGQEPDFDPDALALNFAYALCGPAGGALLPADAGAARCKRVRLIGGVRRLGGLTGEPMNTDEIADSLERCFISPNVDDSNMEPANVVDVIDRAARNLSRIAHAITPTDAAAMQTPYGGRVGSLTEAVIYAADSLTKIAEAIGDLASAVRERDA